MGGLSIIRCVPVCDRADSGSGAVLTAVLTPTSVSATGLAAHPGNRRTPVFLTQPHDWEMYGLMGDLSDRSVTIRSSRTTIYTLHPWCCPGAELCCRLHPWPVFSISVEQMNTLGSHPMLLFDPLGRSPIRLRRTEIAT